ncbi:unnamed protein product [Lampetra planeri]
MNDETVSTALGSRVRAASLNPRQSRASAGAAAAAGNAASSLCSGGTAIRRDICLAPAPSGVRQPLPMNSFPCLGGRRATDAAERDPKAAAASTPSPPRHLPRSVSRARGGE